MFNLLKHYPELLELVIEENARMHSLRRIFDRDIVENQNFLFCNKQIYPIKADGKPDLDREFMHLTHHEVLCEDGIAHRQYDPLRSERLHWIRTHVEDRTNDDSEIYVFSVQERDKKKRTDIVRTYIYNKTRKYVVVFEPQRNGTAYYLLTAYYIDQEAGEKAMMKRLKRRMDTLK